MQSIYLGPLRSRTILASLSACLLVYLAVLCQGGDMFLLYQSPQQPLQSLEDVFSAPLDAVGGFVVDHMPKLSAPGGGPMVGTPRPWQAGDVKVGTTLQLQSDKGPLQLTISSPVDRDGNVKVHVRYWDGQLDGVLHIQSEQGREGTRAGNVKVLELGTLHASQMSAASKKFRSLKLVAMPQGWYAYDPMEGVANKETRFAGIHIEAPSCGCPGCPCDAKAHLKIDVFCPPYVAPDHGSVWYKGRQFNDSTSVVPTSRQSIRVGSKMLPVAEQGDIPEGGFVQITCNEHFQLSHEGSEIPRCLSTGEFQRGKTCEPIMCSAYYPPDNGGVWPDTPVQAGTTVTVYCFEGFEEDYGDHRESRKPPPPQAKLRPGSIRNALQRLREGKWKQLLPRQQTLVTTRGRDVEFRGGEGGGRGKGVGRVRHPAIGRLMRFKALARLREKREDRRRRMARTGLPVLPMDDVMGGSEEAVDEAVRHFVDTGTTGLAPAWAHKRETMAEAVRSDPSLARPQARDSSPPLHGGVAGARRLLSVGDGGGGADGNGAKGRKQRRKKHPMCLDSGRFEQGITCKPIPGLPPGSAPPRPPPPGSRAATTISSPPQPLDFPPVAHCPAYVAPEHGSVWYKGKEHKIATPGQIEERQFVTITCDEYYRLSDRGSRWPECLHDGQWERGKWCEPVMCPPYRAPLHGSVDVCEAVRAGTRVTITCDSFYEPVGEAAGASETPMCLVGRGGSEEEGGGSEEEGGGSEEEGGGSEEERGGSEEERGGSEEEGEGSEEEGGGS